MSFEKILLRLEEYRKDSEANCCNMIGVDFNICINYEQTLNSLGYKLIDEGRSTICPRLGTLERTLVLFWGTDGEKRVFPRSIYEKPNQQLFDDITCCAAFGFLGALFSWTYFAVNSGPETMHISVFTLLLMALVTLGVMCSIEFAKERHNGQVSKKNIEKAKLLGLYGSPTPDVECYGCHNF